MSNLNYIIMPQNIEKKLEEFKSKLDVSGCSNIQGLNYLALYRHILEADAMPEEEIIRRAIAIKPLVRLTGDGKVRDDDDFKDDDQLVFIKPCDIRQSYLYNFNRDAIVFLNTNAGGFRPLPVPELTKVAEFTCYHRYGGYYGFFRPGVDEVLSQIPRSVNVNKVSLFEIKTKSMDFHQVYDSLLDRHVTTVILYASKDILPDRVRSQPVICNDITY